MEGFHLIHLTDDVWGGLSIWRAIPTPEDSWGPLGVLRGTPWEARIPVISGTAMSHATHGRVDPLMNEIGDDPKYLGGRIPEKFRYCSSIRTCPIAGPSCKSGNPYLSDCYEAPLSESSASLMATFVSLCWRNGDYVVVVEGEEFSLR